jgi:hypothetical protein
MLTRRQWLTANPRPKSPVNLQALLEQERHTETELQSQITQLLNQITLANQTGKTLDPSLNRDLVDLRTRQADTARNIAVLTAEIARAVKCPLHQAGLHYHRNRVEDLYICENGPHFLFWTLQGGKPQLIPVLTLQLPGLDFPMTEGTKISRAEWLATHQPRFGAPCPNCKQPLAMQAPDVFVCDTTGERFLWTKTPQGPGFVPMKEELPPPLESPID